MAMAKCAYCGAETKEGIKFCGSCGRQINLAPPPEAIEAKPSPKDKILGGFDYKKYIKPAAAAVAALVVVIAAVLILTPARYEPFKGSVYIDQCHENESVIIVPHRGTRIEIDGRLIDQRRSLDGKTAAVRIDDYNTRGASSLYLITNQPILVSESVHHHWLAASGNAVAYTTGYNWRDNTVELWLYTKGTHTRVGKDFRLGNNCVFLSPDGKTLAFFTGEDDKYTGFVWDGKLHELGRDIYPFAVSNKARYIYYRRNDAVFVQKGTRRDNRERLGETLGFSVVYMNKDLSQLVYTSNNRTFISVKGGERQLLSGGAVASFVTPHDMAWLLVPDYTVLGISSFANTFFVNHENSVIQINRKLEPHTVARNASHVHLANDGKTLTYLHRGSIYKIDGSKADAQAVEIVDQNVTSFVATADGKAVFYVNDIDELWYQKGRGRSVMVSSYFKSNSRDYTLFKGNTLFYISDDELYSSSGGRGRLVSGIDGRVRHIYVDAMGIQVRVNEDGQQLHYRSVDGRRFELKREE